MITRLREKLFPEATQAIPLRVIFLIGAARMFQGLLWTLAGVSIASVILCFPGVIVYGFWPCWALVIGVTVIWWALLLSIAIREKWDIKP